MKELSLQNCRLDGRYDINKLLGRGSYAEIFVARDKFAPPDSPHQLVVIKALNVFLQGDLDNELERTLVENFQNEAAALDRVRHPNIISRLGHGTARDMAGTVFHYIVLEFLPGGEIAKLCSKEPLPFQVAMGYLEQVCAGLSFAHSRSVIHRDIKPQNLLLTANHQTVKIADFGVAKIAITDAPITRVGTNIYAAPEHSPLNTDLHGDLNTKLTAAADIYSLAKTAYVMFTGESPRRFSGQQINELPVSVKHEIWSNDVLRVLQKATKTNPAERYQTALDFWKELAKIGIQTAETLEDIDAPTRIAVKKPNLVPMAAVSDTFVAEAPARPKFSSTRDFYVKSMLPQTPENDPRVVVKIPSQPAPPVQPQQNQHQSPGFQPPQTTYKKPNFLRRALVMLLLLTVFAGILFATHNYLRQNNLLPAVISPNTQKGTTTTGLKIRSSANDDTDDNLIGILGENTEITIYSDKTVGNWLYVKVDKFKGTTGKPVEAGTTGYVSKRYVKIIQ
jgi:serine/threonine-protein kinase